MPSKLENEFIEEFKACAEYLTLPVEQTVSAERALREIFRPYENQTRLALTATPYFASHGPDHAVSLSRIAKKFITTITAEDLVDSLKSPECLILLFGSLILHDIGMAVLPDGTTDIQETQKNQLTREGHDDRSLVFIEKNLIPYLSKYPGWQAFWAPYGESRNWPRPASTNALFLLARICKSHGDDISVWLTTDSFDTYTKTDGTILDFQQRWGTRWAGVKRIALTAATLLNFCDLCDLGDQRFRDLPEDWKRLLLPEDPSRRKLSFVHWLGHQVASVDFHAGTVMLQIAGTLNTDFSDMLLLQHGPAADLRYWLSMPRLRTAIETYVTPKFNGLTITKGPMDEVTWGDIYQAAFEEHFLDCWPCRDLNTLLFQSAHSANEFDKIVTAPLWWLSACRSWKREIPSPENEYFDLDLLARLRESGLLVEDLIEVTTPLPGEKVLIAAYDENARDATLFELGNSFLTALKAARELMVADPVNVREIHFAFKGNTVFTNLLEGTVDEYQDCIIMCQVRRAPLVEKTDLIKMVHTISTSPFGVRLFFFGRENELAPLRELGISECHGQSRSAQVNKLLGSNYVVRKLETDKVRVEEDPERNYQAFDASPAEAFLHLYRRGNHSDGLIELFTHQLKIKDQQITSDTLGILLYLTLYDFLNLPLRGMKAGELRTHYDQVREILSSRLEISSWQQAHLTLSRWGLVSDTTDSLLSEPEHQRTIAEIRSRAASRSGKAFLMQLVVLYRLQAQGQLYNFASETLIEDAAPQVIFNKVVEFIYDEASDAQARATMAFGFAEHLGKYSSAISLDDAAQPLLRQEMLSLKSGLFGLIVWQMFYRIFRATKPWKENIQIENYLKMPIPQLGLLEAIGSNADLQDIEVNDNVATVVQTICSGFMLSDPDWESEAGIAAMLAVDIVWKYQQKNPTLRAGGANLLAWGAPYRLSEFAEYYHSPSPPSEVPALDAEADRVIFTVWQDLRNRFLRLIVDFTPEELKRTGVSDEVLHKAGVRSAEDEHI